MPIVVDRRLQSCTNAELRFIIRRLTDLWELKGYMDVEDMPRHWQIDVEKVRRELDRRGVHLQLF